MSSEKETKAWQRYTKGKGVAEKNPELSWLGNEEGLKQDQKIRFLDMLSASYGITNDKDEVISLRKSMAVQTDSKYTHEDNINEFAKERFDTITHLSILSTDDTPRKKLLIDDKDDDEDNGVTGGKVK